MKIFPVKIDQASIFAVSGELAAESGWDFSPQQFSVGIAAKMLRGIKGLIFDFDGTLYDNARIPLYLIAANPLDWRRIWKERLVRKSFAGCDFAGADEYHSAFFAALGKICGRSPQRARNWYFNRYIPRMARVLKKHYQCRPGGQDLLRRLNDGGLRVAVYSDYPALKERMEAIGLPTSPQVPLYGPESFGAQKPAERPFREIAGNLGLAPEEVLVIGDREDTDGLGAFRAGMHFFCLETGRKRYIRLDPNRRRTKEKPQGPSLLMYAGTWDDIRALLMERLGAAKSAVPLQIAKFDPRNIRR